MPPACHRRPTLARAGILARVQTPDPALAQYFDTWYSDMTGSAVKDEIEQRHLGLPPWLLSTSLLTWAGIGEVTDALRLAPGGTLADLACGRGGYGLEIAARTGARLTGIDFSAEAIRQARSSPVSLAARPSFASATSPLPDWRPARRARRCAPWTPSSSPRAPTVSCGESWRPAAGSC